MSQQRAYTFVAVIAVLLASCLPPSIASPHVAGVPVVNADGTTVSSLSPSEFSAIPVPTPTMRAIKIEVGASQTSGAGRTEVTVIPTPFHGATPAAVDATIGNTVSSEEEVQNVDESSVQAPLPALTKGLTSDELRDVCGYGTVAAFDGHELRTTPEIPLEGGNQVALLPEGTRVYLVDCIVWIDDDLLPWLAVQTTEGKMGWMVVQPDKFYVQILPVAHEPPRVTSIPPGSTVGYAPRQECQERDTSTEAQAASIAADFTPIIGDVKGLQEATTGCDAITGEPLGDWRWLGLLGLIGVAELGVLRHADGATDAARVIGKGQDAASVAGKNVDETVAAAGRNVDEFPGVVRNSGHVDDLTSAGRSLDTLGEVTYDTNRVVSVGGSGLSVTELTARGYTPDDAAYIASKFEQPCSFSADTEVATEDGLVPISEIEIGDRVLAYHEAIGETGYFTVTNVFAHFDPVVLHLTIGDERIETTPDHPFYFKSEWVVASQLFVGDLLESHSGRIVAVVKKRIEHRPQIMYNLTVADAHTYFVGEGGWLVHNACSRKLRSSFPGTSEELMKIRKYEQENGVLVSWQAHHVIPGQLETEPFVKIAMNEGKWKIDDATDNGIALPAQNEVAKALGLPSHRGPHGRYTADVQTRLNEEMKAYEDSVATGKPLTASEIRAMMDNVVKDFRDDLKNGRYGTGTRLN